MPMRPTRYTARWVLPVTSPPIPDGAVLIDARGRIAAVGPAEAVPLPDEAERIDLGEAALLPGLVNAHAHPELAAFRGLIEDLTFADWIKRLMRTKRRAPLSVSDEALAARWSCVETLAAGITTVAATEESGEALGAFVEAGLRGIVYREVFGPRPEDAAGAIDGLRAAVERMRRDETELVRVGVSPHAPFSVSDPLFRLTAEYATREELPIAVHTAESEVERLLVTKGAGPFADGLRSRGIETPPRAETTVRLLERTGVLEARPLLIHCVQLENDDIARIAASGASVVHCPAANARLGHGIAPLLELLDAGVPVGLGTDSVASNNRLDLLEEARVAQLLQRAASRSATALPTADLLRLVTIDGARALGLDARVGSLEPGKDADLCAISISAPHARPVNDVLAAVFHAARATDVRLTAVRGRVLYRDGGFLSLDPATLADGIDSLALRLRRTSRGV